MHLNTVTMVPVLVPADLEPPSSQEIGNRLADHSAVYLLVILLLLIIATAALLLIFRGRQRSRNRQTG